MKTKILVCTITELQEELNLIVTKGRNILDVRLISTIGRVDSFFEDNIIRAFSLSYNRPDVPTNKED